jgi:GNAT superfamily N-acetyltransferase
MQTLQTPQGKIRRFDLARDGESVADLIEGAFGLKNDPDGQNVLIQMRENARRLKQASWMPLSGSVLGFVWEIDGRLVGNVSLLPFTHESRRIHLLANVAVDPAYRGEGIGKALTSQALQFSRQVGVRELWLQVKRDNDSAIRMYEQLGFTREHCLDVWKKSASHNRKRSQQYRYPSLYELRDREFGDWQSQDEWLRRNYPPATRWYSALDFGNLSPWAWLDPLKWGKLIELRQFSLSTGQRLAAVLSLQRTSLRSDNLYLAAPQTSSESEYVGVLLTQFLQEHWTGKPLTVEYPTGRAASGFESSGFTLARTLLWMHAKI